MVRFENSLWLCETFAWHGVKSELFWIGTVAVGSARRRIVLLPLYCGVADTLWIHNRPLPPASRRAHFRRLSRVTGRRTGLGYTSTCLCVVLVAGETLHVSYPCRAISDTVRKSSAVPKRERVTISRWLGIRACCWNARLELRLFSIVRHI